jgi:hypothetical protein
MIKMDEIPVHKEGIEARELGDEVIIISADGKFMHTLVDTGRFIWESIDGKKTIKSILDLICKEYKVKKEQAKPDLLKFINLILTKKLIDVRED